MLAASLAEFSEKVTDLVATLRVALGHGGTPSDIVRVNLMKEEIAMCIAALGGHGKAQDRAMPDRSEFYRIDP